MLSRQESPLTFDHGPWRCILGHTLHEYPNEACGILLSSHESPFQIKKAYPTRNAASDNRRRRFFVDPVDFLKADRLGEEERLDICGFYHSHPDHPAIPSEYDLVAAWLDRFYLILAIQGGRFSDAKAWLLNSEKEQFNEVMIHWPNLEGSHESAPYPAEISGRFGEGDN